MKKLCNISKDGEALICNIYKDGKISKRGVDKIKKLSMTIALMDDQEQIQPYHIIEALSYRNDSFLKEVLGDDR